MYSNNCPSFSPRFNSVAYFGSRKRTAGKWNSCIVEDNIISVYIDREILFCVYFSFSRSATVYILCCPVLVVGGVCGCVCVSAVRVVSVTEDQCVRG